MTVQCKQPVGGELHEVKRCGGNLLLVTFDHVAARLTILGSGSGGNCSYLECGETRILIDAGFSGRQIRQRLATIGRTPETLTGILITHEHSDHVQGLTALTAKLKVPIYCNRLTKEALDQQVQGRADFRVFSTGSSFEVGEMSVDSFSIPHDANDPVGFLVKTAFAKVGFLTDLGQATKLVLERVRGATALLLEANYDVKLLNEDSRRPWSVKQRIQSRHGHLSNDAAAEVAEQILSAELKQLFLGHLSRDCNTPELASAAVTNRLAGIGGAHVRVAVVSQEAPTETCCFEADPSVAASACDPAPVQVSSS